MNELSFYDGAYSFPQIDAAIALIADNLSDITVTDRTGGALSNLTYKVAKIGRMVFFSFRATTTAAISAGAILQIDGLPPAQTGNVFTIFEGYDVKTGRVNPSAGTNGLVYTNAALASNKNISASGMYFV